MIKAAVGIGLGHPAGRAQPLYGAERKHRVACGRVSDVVERGIETAEIVDGGRA